MPLPLTQELSPRDNHLQMKIHILQGSLTEEANYSEEIRPMPGIPLFSNVKSRLFFKVIFYFYYIHTFFYPRRSLHVIMVSSFWFSVFMWFLSVHTSGSPSPLVSVPCLWLLSFWFCPIPMCYFLF